MSNVLVTGGAGFIGSHTVEKLLKEGHFVVSLDNLDPYYDSNLKKRNIEIFRDNENYVFIEGSILDKYSLQKVIEDNSIEYVIHQAAQAGVRISVQNPRKPAKINTEGTLNLLEASRESRVKKVVNASSSSVYGKAVELPFKETSPNIPVSPYGVSKLASEHYCRIFNEIYDLPTTSLRYFTVYGPRMRPDLAISIFTIKALANEPIEIFGDGSFTRDFTYVEDIANGTVMAMESDRSNGEIFNIGGAHRISINELAERIIKLTGSESKIIHSERQKGDAEHTWADISKAKEILGWSPVVDIDEGLMRYIKWWQNQTYNEKK